MKARDSSDGRDNLFYDPVPGALQAPRVRQILLFHRDVAFGLSELVLEDLHLVARIRGR